MTAAILVRYGEIALKGKNRMFFEKTLLENIKFALKGLGARVVRMHGRLLIMGAADEEEEITRRLSRVFGVVSVSSVETAPLDLEAIKEKALEIMERSLLPGDSFKVEARRSNKSFPLTSPELNRIIGGAILEKYLV